MMNQLFWVLGLIFVYFSIKKLLFRSPKKERMTFQKRYRQRKEEREGNEKDKSLHQNG